MASLIVLHWCSISVFHCKEKYDFQIQINLWVSKLSTRFFYDTLTPYILHKCEQKSEIRRSKKSFFSYFFIKKLHASFWCKYFLNGNILNSIFYQIYIIWILMNINRLKTLNFYLFSIIFKKPVRVVCVWFDIREIQLVKKK